MEKIVYKYLNKTYKFTLSTYSSYKLYDKVNKVDVGLKTAINEVILIFSISKEELTPIFEKWCDDKSTAINNRIVDLQFLLYEQTGQGDTYINIDDLNTNIGDV